MAQLEPLARLIRALSKLPGIGRRSAERIAMSLVTQPGTVSQDLVHALQEVASSVCTCERCGQVTTADEDPCAICRNPARQNGLLCVVSDPVSIGALESSGAFRGRYHAMMGKISPMHREGVQHLRVQSLLKRIREERVTEVLLALDSDTESEATVSFLKDVLEATSVRVSRLAYGLPAGSGVSYSDPLTLSRAISGRQNMDASHGA